MLTDREVYMALVDNDLISKADAIILLEGDGYNRYQHAVELYKQGVSAKIVFSGGITDYTYGSVPFEKIRPMLLNAGVKEVDLIWESISQNTREQACEVVNLALKYGWKRLVLVASPEHQYRAYLTFLKKILEMKSNIILMNSPAKNLKWFASCDWGIRTERLNQEFERIERYSVLGHLATFQEAITYQKWKEQQ